MDPSGCPPIYAVIVPLLAMRDDPYSAFNTSFDRLLGVVAGILLGVLVARWLGPSVLAVGLVLLVALLGGIVLRIGTSLNLQVSVSALIVFANPDPGSLAVARLWETAVGAVVTVCLSPVLLPADSRAAYSRAYGEVTARIGHQLSELSVLVPRATEHAGAVRTIRETSLQTERSAEGLPDKLSGALRSVRYNPLRRDQLPVLRAMSEPTTQVIALASALRILVEDIAEFSTRADVAPTWERRGAPLSRVLSEMAAAASVALSAGGVNPATRSALTTAGTELETWRAAAQAPVDAVLRRPAYRMLHALEALEAMESPQSRP